MSSYNKLHSFIKIQSGKKYLPSQIILSKKKKENNRKIEKKIKVEINNLNIFIK